ncbi:MAG TPA: DinB family protein [Vicinamibacteria bacterium]|nr:DinB family protein [Vicinamibacteria bacterium]
MSVPIDPALARRLARLEASRRRALDVVGSAPHAALNRPPAPGKWSALQLLHHVVTAEALTLRYIRKKMQAGLALEKAGPASRLRLLALQVTLALPLRIKAPAVTGDVPAESELGALRARWDEVRSDLDELVRLFPPELLDRLVFRHPYAGRMTLAHALGTLEAHLDHHIPQVERALASGT